jgi:CheY-like chemotaxis protein
LPEAKGADKQETLSSVPPSRRGTILIVDDEVAVIRSLRRILQIDHDVFAASSGEEALRIIQSNQEIDIILYDISIPRLGAPEFLDALKRIHYPSSERVVFVSGGSTDIDVSLFLQETPNQVIEKPFNLPELNEIIAAMLK